MDVTPTATELISLFERGELASQMARRFGMSGGGDIHVLEEHCIKLHNSGSIDLLALVEGDSLQQLSDGNFFMASYFLCRLLPELDETPERMMRCIDGLVIRGGQDLAANEPNAAFRTWCERAPLRAKEVIAAANEGHELACQYLSFALEAIEDLVETRRIAFEYEGVCRQSALAALGRIKHLDSESCAQTFAILNKVLDRGIEDSVKASVLDTAMRILAADFDFSHADAEQLVSRLTDSPDRFTVHQCARSLWAYRPTLTKKMVSLLLDALVQLDSANKGTVKELDLGLRALLEHGHEDAAVSFVTKLLSNSKNKLDLESLDSFTRTLFSGPSELLSQVVVQWLELGNPRLCRGLAEAVEGPGLDGAPLYLKAEHLALSPATQLFICRKAIGWFFFKPTTAASVLVSVLRACEEDTAQEIRVLLIDPLLQNYGGVREYLEGIAPEDSAYKSVAWALAQNEVDISAQCLVPLILELQPSEHHRRIENMRISDQFRDGHKQAESSSVLLSMVSRSVLLYGNRSTSFVDDGDGKLRPFEINLQSHGISFEMPRMEIIDPVGLDYTLRTFRNERMEK